MALFDITTIERWEHRVEYHGVEADSIEETYGAIRDGEIAYDDQETTGEGDQVICIAAIEDENGKALAIPPEHDIYTGPIDDDEAYNLRRALADLLEDMAEVGEDRHPETGEEFATSRNARQALADFDKAHPELKKRAQIEDCPTPQQESRTVNNSGEKIEAECHSDDRAAEVKFNAVDWFYSATDAQIAALAECGWGGDYPADYIAQWCAQDNEDLAGLFRYVEHRHRIDSCGFECHVDETQARAWLERSTARTC